MAYKKLDLKNGDKFTAGDLGHIESALSEVISSDEGKAPQATLDARVPADLGLRVDTTVGTRVFAGSTMIYGDTRWRLVPSTDPSVNVYMRRVNEKVYARVSTTAFAGSGTTKVVDIPMGLRPENINRLLYSENSGDAPSKLLVAFPSQAWLELRSKTQDAPVYFDVSWITVDPWPTA